jgi:hypothetical protein
MSLQNAPHSFKTPVPHLERSSMTQSSLVQPEGHLGARDKSGLWQQDEEFLPLNLSVLESCSSSCSNLSKDLESLTGTVLLHHQKHRLTPSGVARDRSNAADMNAILALPSLDLHQGQDQDGASTFSSHSKVTPGKISPL